MISWIEHLNSGVCSSVRDHWQWRGELKLSQLTQRLDVAVVDRAYPGTYILEYIKELQGKIKLCCASEVQKQFTAGAGWLANLTTASAGPSLVLFPSRGLTRWFYFHPAVFSAGSRRFPAAIFPCRSLVPIPKLQHKSMWSPVHIIMITWVGSYAADNTHMFTCYSEIINLPVNSYKAFDASNIIQQARIGSRY